MATLKRVPENAEPDEFCMSFYNFAAMRGFATHDHDSIPLIVFEEWKNHYAACTFIGRKLLHELNFLMT